MKAKNIIGAGLCSILLATSPIVSGQQAKADPQKKLEWIADSPYIGPDGNYSITISPTVSRFFRPTHVAQQGGYRDAYPPMPTILPGVLIIENVTTPKSVDEFYQQYKDVYVNILTNSISKSLAPGQKVQSIDDKPMKNLLVDNHPAIQGDIRFRIIDVYGNKVDKTLEYKLLITLAQGKNSLYGFTYNGLSMPGADELYAKNYNSIIRRFHALK